MVVKMKFLPTFLEFCSAKWFSKEISRLICRRDELDPNCIVFNFLSSKMKINLKMLGLFMEDRVVAQFYATLIVTEQVSGFVVQNF